jgi:hypothetical protein
MICQDRAGFIPGSGANRPTAPRIVPDCSQNWLDLKFALRRCE